MNKIRQTKKIQKVKKVSKKKVNRTLKKYQKKYLCKWLND